ncbi:MAG TPA: hypothetical protein VMV10_14220 [Pirellulales bacterium]|nr:hypothetical protein [Pirellulales bacterium]
MSSSPAAPNAACRTPLAGGLFTIADELVLVLAIRRAAQDRLHPDDLSN